MPASAKILSTPSAAIAAELDRKLAAESARLVDWFCANHPMQARQIERDVRNKMQKQGWRV
jgi:hypothetical protein